MTRTEALGVWARLPRGLTRSPRRRRLAFVGASAPGVLMAVLGTELRHDPRWLGSGVALLLLLFLARRLSEPRFLAWEAGAVPPALSFEESLHEPNS